MRFEKLPKLPNSVEKLPKLPKNYRVRILEAHIALLSGALSTGTNDQPDYSWVHKEKNSGRSRKINTIQFIYWYYFK